MRLPNNTHLQNRYLIVRLLGQGGFGAVYEAKDLRLGHRVALKQLTLGGPQVEKAFEREARILARLKHGALPKVSDYFVYFNDYFLVMEYIEGNDFEALLKQRTALFPVEQVLEWADQLLDGLDYLHRQQPPVIHRDIKPGNIKLSPAGKIYLLDFGISKGGQAYTYQAASGGSIYAFSPHYASMEQIEGRGTDARSDLYSLAVTLHHFLSKQKPPQTISRANARLMNRADPLRPVNELNPQVPVEVAQVLTSAVDFDPNLRPQSARAMRQMLKDAIAQKKAPSLAIPSASSIATTLLPPPTKPPTSPSLPRPWLGGVGVLFLLIGLLVGRVLFGAPLPIPQLVAHATRIAQKDGMVQVYVPEGDFEMGSADDDPDARDDEKPRHTVLLSAFWIDQTEVTNAQYAQCVADGACQPPSSNRSSTRESYYGNAEFDSYPVVNVSWHDATAYCQWAERRLPTEAQWEKAAGGVLTEEGTRKWPWGNEQPNEMFANFDDIIGDTTPAGKYPAGASPYGAYDMAGNVWEWVFDEYDATYYNTSPRENPTGPSGNGTKIKILRGGSWLNGVILLRPGSKVDTGSLFIRVRKRLDKSADHRDEDSGIRCASSP